MERREVLKLGLAVGAGMVLTKIPGTEALAETSARATTAKFYDGNLDGDLDGWNIVFTVVGARVSAFAHLVRGGEGSTDGFGLIGNVSGGNVQLEGFSIDGSSEPAASFTGKLSAKQLTGTIELANAAGGGAVKAKVVKKDAKTMKKLSGNYEASTAGPSGDEFAFYSCLATVRSNGTFELFDGEDPHGKPIDGRLAGYFVVKSKKTIYVATLPASASRKGPRVAECCVDVCPNDIRYLFYGRRGVIDTNGSLRLTEHEQDVMNSMNRTFAVAGRTGR